MQKKSKSPERLSIPQKRMIEAMQKSLGHVTLACKKSKTARSSHYHWLKTNAKYRDALFEVEDRNIDNSETRLLTNIKGGDQRAVEFHLERKGKHRGYGKTVEICDINLSSEDPVEQMNEIMIAMASGRMSFQMGDRLMKGIQMKIDMIDQVETQNRLKRIEDMLDGKDKN